MNTRSHCIFVSLVVLAGWAGPAAWMTRAEEPRRKGYALLIGCAKYDVRELQSLEFTRNDIQAFHKALLEAGFASDNVILMHDTQEGTCCRRQRRSANSLTCCWDGSAREGAC